MDAKKSIEEAANMIGINDSIFWWMAELAATVDLPAKWQTYETNEGTTAYFHPELQINQKHHPGMARFKEMYQKQKKFYDRMCDKIPGFAPMHEKLKKNLANKIFKFLARCDFWVNSGWEILCGIGFYGLGLRKIRV